MNEVIKKGTVIDVYDYTKKDNTKVYYIALYNTENHQYSRIKCEKDISEVYEIGMSSKIICKQNYFEKVEYLEYVQEMN